MTSDGPLLSARKAGMEVRVSPAYTRLKIDTEASAVTWSMGILKVQ